MELNGLRQELDQLDGELLRLFLRRMALCRLIGAVKRRDRLPMRDAARERAVLANRASQCASAWQKPYARLFFSFVMALSRRVQESDARCRTHRETTIG